MLKVSRLSAFIAAARLRFGASISMYSTSASSVVVAGGQATFSITASGTPPISYQWRKNGVDIPGATDRILTIPSAQPSDVASYRGVATNVAGSVISSNLTLSIETPVTITSHPASQTVNLGELIILSVSVSGSSPFYYQWKKNGVNISGATESTLGYVSVASNAGSYTVVVSNQVSSATSNAATVAVNVPVAPTITTQPISRSVGTGASVNFSVTASGTSPLSYQWRKGGSNISGATSATYNIASAEAANAGNYDVVVTNAAGSVVSNTVTLSVVTSVSITSQPASQTVSLGAQASFTVAATGTGPITYQWQKSSANISGATSATLTISSSQSANAGTYRVVVTNSAGSVTSNSVTLSITNVVPTFGNWTTLNTGLTTPHTILKPAKRVQFDEQHYFPLLGENTILTCSTNNIFTAYPYDIASGFANGSPVITKGTTIVTTATGLIGSFQYSIGSNQRVTIYLYSNPLTGFGSTANTLYGIQYPTPLGQSLSFASLQA